MMSSDSPATESQARFPLIQPVENLPGVSKSRAKLLAKLGIEHVADLVRHLPHRWEYHAGQTPIGQLQIDTIATAIGQVATCRLVRHGRRGRAASRFELTMDDETHRLSVVWFNAPYLRDRIHPGAWLAVTGKVVRYNDYRQMVNPTWNLLDEPPAGSTGGDEHYRPVYPTTEGLTSEQLERLIRLVLPDALEQIKDHLDADFRRERELPALHEAYRMLHQPDDEHEPAQARRRLAYDELLLLQTGLTLRHRHTVDAQQAPALRWSQAIDQHIRQRFPFELTEGQNHAVRQIAADLQQTRPMNRLLQGDVGSGKTVVALYAMLMAAASGRQAALMAPTEILAEQHHLSIGGMLDGSNVRIALVTGSLPASERAALADDIERGRIDLVIGTQALLSQSVQFSDLAVVVIDEQHRFGVTQRAGLRSKHPDGTTMPHTLVMTATPIPRTLSLTVFGDLDVSNITGQPPGRQPITTRVVTQDKTDQVYPYIAQQIAGGAQAYIVLPTIDQSRTDLRAVRSHAQWLSEGPLADCHIATMHGRMKSTTREQIMQRFRNGQIDALVTTTVIEVGVDVPNASLMVIEHAERFGLAQLHQLRGRIGRGERKSLCVLIAEISTDDARQRLEAIARTTDGFDIAEADLLIRGMGELIGTRQSGLPPLQAARIPQDMDLVQMARRDAQQFIEADPLLQAPAHRLLRARLMKQYREALDLGDVA